MCHFLTDSDTTDVQAVGVVAMECIDKIRIQCNFIISSDAHGCKVVLVGELSNATVNLPRENRISQMFSFPIHCHTHSPATRVFVFDIEADGFN